MPCKIENTWDQEFLKPALLEKHPYPAAVLMLWLWSVENWNYSNSGSNHLFENGKSIDLWGVLQNSSTWSDFQREL